MACLNKRRIKMTGVIIVAVIGLISGLILSVASVVFAVPVDEKQEAVRECLPGANCGACGYSGCDGYAKALVDGTAEIGLCSPGGPDVAEECAEMLGKAVGAMEKKVAMIQCGGHYDNVGTKFEYHGIDTCKAVTMIYAGDSTCAYGCLGHGDCVAVCPENAITVCNGLAVVNEEACISCGLCKKACPKNIIEIVPAGIRQHVRCKNTDKGGETRKVCRVGCIGCMKCQKTCPFEAITVANNNATINYEKCKNCGKCKDVCPVNAIA